jgi:anti-sigma28 factor (negative regulator of flagellin synthesis)
MMHSTEGQPVVHDQEERALKVERLKRLVQNGEYQTDAHALADRLIDAGMVENQNKDDDFVH